MKIEIHTVINGRELEAAPEQALSIPRPPGGPDALERGARRGR